MIQAWCRSTGKGWSNLHHQSQLDGTFLEGNRRRSAKETTTQDLAFTTTTLAVLDYRVLQNRCQKNQRRTQDGKYLRPAQHGALWIGFQGSLGLWLWLGLGLGNDMGRRRSKHKLCVKHRTCTVGTKERFATNGVPSTALMPPIIPVKKWSVRCCILLWSFSPCSLFSHSTQHLRLL